MNSPFRERYEISPIKLHSLLRSRLAESGQARGTPEQWIGTIRNLKKKGVSEVEIEWSDVIPVLAAEKRQSIQLTELLDFLDDSPPCELRLQRLISDEYTPVVRYQKCVRPAALPPIEVCHGRREIRLLHYTDRSFGFCIWLHVQVDKGLFGRHSYWSFLIPRGRKKLTTESMKRRFMSANEAMAYGRKLVDRLSRRLGEEGYVGQVKAINHYDRWVLPGGLNYSEWLITAPNLRDEFVGEHFDLVNVVAHVRTTERRSPNGDRLLVLEEIQSDWNQTLRTVIQHQSADQPESIQATELIGWGDDEDCPPMNPYLNHWLEASLRMMITLAAHQGFTGVAWLPGEIHAERFAWANREGLETFYDQIVPTAFARLAKSWGESLSNTQFSTLTRNFLVRKRPRGSVWEIVTGAKQSVVGESYRSFAEADVSRQSMESSTLETVPFLPISSEIRNDIIRRGLPYLGTTGSRIIPRGSSSNLPDGRLHHLTVSS